MYCMYLKANNYDLFDTSLPVFETLIHPSLDSVCAT